MNQFSPYMTAQEDITPFIWPDLVELSADNAILEAKLLRSGAKRQFNIGKRLLNISAPTRKQMPTGLTATLSFGDMIMQVRGDEDIIGHLLDCHDIHDDWPAYSAHTNAIVAEHLLSDAIAPLETILDGPFRVVQIADDTEPPNTPSMTVVVTDADEQEMILSISADAAILKKLAQVPSAAPAPKSGANLGRLTFPSCLMGPSFGLPQGEFDDLEAGDGLFLLDLDWDAFKFANIIVADRLSIPVIIKGTTIEVVGALKKSTHYKEIAMASLAKAETTTLPVVMSIELASSEITLEDLSELANGSFLHILDEWPSQVRVKANGKDFADAELVRISGKIALRLIKIFS